jgi:hypothetical protein
MLQDVAHLLSTNGSGVNPTHIYYRISTKTYSQEYIQLKVMPITRKRGISVSNSETYVAIIYYGV